MLYFVQMNNEKQRRCTTILLADARGLEDQAAFSHFLPTVNTERQRDIGCKRFDEEKVLSLAGGLLLDMLLDCWNIPAQIEHGRGGKPYLHPHM